MMDIEVLRLIWWVLIGVIFMGFALTDGWDLGMAAILPLVARTDTEKRVVLNVIGPFWEGNQVWIILGAGALLAAWPFVYAIAFSSFYLLILLLLLTLGISRPVSFKYRSKLTSPLWRNTWDRVVFVCGGVLPAIILGVLVGNVMTGVPFSFNQQLQVTYHGTFFQLLNPFSLWCGLTSLVMLVMHGGLYLAIKSEDPIRERAIFCAQLAAVLLIVFFAGDYFWVAKVVPGYILKVPVDPHGFSNPINKQIQMQIGAWLYNYKSYPLLYIAPISGFAGAALAIVLSRFKNTLYAFLCSGLSIIGVIATIGVGMFPFILPSSMEPNSSLLIWDSSSSELTLFLMLIAVFIFLPIILMYTGWVFYVLRGKVKEKTIVLEKQAY